MISQNVFVPLRVFQSAFSLIVLGFTAYVASWWSKYWRDTAPSQINFLLFSSIWTILSLGFLTAAALPRFRNMTGAFQLVQLVVEALTMMFWFGGFVALAVFLSARVCFGTVCNVAKAGVVFAALQWLLFAATASLTGINAFRKGRGHQIGKGVDAIRPPATV